MEHEKNEEHHKVEVSVTYANTGRTVKFAISKDATLQQLFDEAYAKLGEPKRSTDTYFCINGTSMAGELNMKVEEIIHHKCKEAKFEIRGPTGGAF